jgi:hypothetical protein
MPSSSCVPTHLLTLQSRVRFEKPLVAQPLKNFSKFYATPKVHYLVHKSPTMISMGFVGYVTVCVQLYCVSFHCLSLQVSAYMAIFRCVGYFYFHV